MALRGALDSGLGARDAAAFCVAGVAQPYIHLSFTWQAWHNLTSTFVSRGTRGTNGTPWRAWVWFGRAWRRGILPGRRGTTLHPPSFHVAGVAQTHIHLRFAWQAWHLWHWVVRLVRICRPWRRGPLRGRRGTWWHPPSFHTSTFVLRGRRGTYGIGWRAWAVCFWTLWLLDIFGKTCTVSVITMVLATVTVSCLDRHALCTCLP